MTLKNNTVVFAIGDVHGMYDNLNSLLLMVSAHVKKVSGRKVLVFLGDYIDRGPDSKKVIDLIMKPIAGFDKIVRLKGNHEDMLLHAIDNPQSDIASIWHINGGLDTLRSYIGDKPSKAKHFMPQKVIPSNHVEFLRKLPVMYKPKNMNYLFVHAGIMPGVPLKEQRPEVVMWIRDRFLDSTIDHGLVVVHGHTVTDSMSPDVLPNRIGIDTGAYLGAPRKLTCVVLDGTNPAKFIQA